MRENRELRWLRRGAILLVLASAVAVAFASHAAEPRPAQDDVLKLMPKDVIGLVVVRRLADTSAKIDKLIETVGGEAPALLDNLRASIAGGQFESLDAERDAALAALPLGEGEELPGLLVYLPTNDYAALSKELGAPADAGKIAEVKLVGSPLLMGRREGYAMLTERKYRAALEAVIDGQTAEPAALKSWTGWIAEQDVVAVADTSGIEWLAAQARKGLDEVREAMERSGAAANPAVAGLGVYETLLKHATEGVALAAVGGRIDAEGNVILSKRARFAPDAAVRKVLAENKSPAAEPLQGLPDEPFVFAAAIATPESLTRLMMDFSMDIMRAMLEIYGLNNEQIDKMVEISRDSLEGFRGMSMMMGVGKPGDPAYANIQGVMFVDDADAFARSYGKYLSATAELMKTGQKAMIRQMGFAEVKPGLWKIEIEVDTAALMGGQEMPPEARAAMPQLFGADGKMTAYMAKVDAKRILFAYAPESNVEAMVEGTRAGKPGLSAQKQLAGTARLLPDQAPLVVYISPSGYMAYTMRLLKPMFERMGVPFQVPEFPACPPIGMAAEFRDGEVLGRVVVPAEALRAIGQFGQAIQNANQQPVLELEM